MTGIQKPSNGKSEKKFTALPGAEVLNQIFGGSIIGIKIMSVDHLRMSKDKCKLFHFLSTFVMLGICLCYILLAYIIGLGHSIFIRREMLPDDIMIGKYYVYK